MDTRNPSSDVDTFQRTAAAQLLQDPVREVMTNDEQESSVPMPEKEPEGGGFATTTTDDKLFVNQVLEECCPWCCVTGTICLLF
mmetsp:Transcript_7732/g.9512  ORF Transcript_7732/g.9512 Transcript_7732/m.9512 type:complete len:84 (-) Transcript_7732:36-287(-)